MGKYDDLFNKNFDGFKFKGNSIIQREIALRIFNKMMNVVDSLDSEEITDEFITEFLNILEEQLVENSPSSKGELIDIEDIFNETDSVILPIFSNTDEMIKKSGLTFESIVLDSKGSGLSVTETWTKADKETLLSQRYLLNFEIFEIKDLLIQEMIVEQLLENNYIKGGSNIYLNALPVDSQKKYYQILLEESIKDELYEHSAIYRDKINEFE